MDSEQVCPVCTLYLRPGITLKEHLVSHPKQKVIEALVRLSTTESTKENNYKDVQDANLPCSTTNTAAPFSTPSFPPQAFASTSFPSATNLPNGNFPNATFPGVNHSIIYQQFMSSSGQNMVNLNPQYITVPTVFNPQVMCSPYFYQQQQVIMSSGPSTIFQRPLPIEMSEINGNSLQPLSSKPVMEVLDTKQDIVVMPKDQEAESKLIEINDDEDEDYEKDVIPKEEVEVIGNKEAGVGTEQDLEVYHIEDKCTTDEENKIINDNDFDQEHHSQHFNKETTELSQTNSQHCSNEIFVQESDNILPESSCINSNQVFYQAQTATQCFNHDEKSFNENTTRNDEPYEIKDDNNDCFTNFNSIVNGSMNIFNVSPNMVHMGTDSATKACQTTSTMNEPIQGNCTQYDVADDDVKDVNFIEMDGMKLVLANDFMANQVISQVDDYESIDRSRILMTIGGMDGIDNKNNTLMDHDPLDTESNAPDSILATEDEDLLLRDDELITGDTLSTESANIRTNERMPARGELSGQEESNECSDDMIWCKIHRDSSREAWEQLEQSSNGNALPPMNPIEQSDFNQEQMNFGQQASISENYAGENAINGIDIANGQDAMLNDYASDVRKSEIAETGMATNKKIVFVKQTKTLTERRIKKEEKESNFEMFSNECSVKEDKDIDVTDTKIQRESCQFLCTTCSTFMPSMKDLKEHKQEVHKECCKYKCNTCGTTFQSEPMYTNHLQIHPLECKLCGKYFYRKQGLDLHLKRHLGIKPFKCDVCNKSFLTKQKREEHQNIHTGATPIKCNLCDETFRRYSNLIQHRNRHHLKLKRKLRDFMCHCGEIFHSVKKLAWHKEIHDLKPKACTYCSEKFLHMSSLTRHMRRAHNENYMPNDERNKENVECPVCKGIYLKSSLETHIRSHSGERPYNCLVCNKSFTTKWNLKLHKWTHAARTSKPFKCDQCNGAFIRESDYVAHMNSHRSVKPYTCNYCGAQFIRKNNCQRHVREHEKEKTYVCEVCNKEFHRSYYLKDHMRTHTGIRPYSCSICGKTSTTKSNHNKHVRIHHAREPISTEN